jgi:hypothetical protein
MAIQTYHDTTRRKPSKFYINSLEWLRSNHVVTPHLTNFQFLMQNIGFGVTWRTCASWNTSARFPRRGEETAPLILGPIDHAMIPGRVPRIKTIAHDEFFYEDPNFGHNEVPNNNKDTPFIIQGIATALRVCLTQTIDGTQPYINTRFYMAKYESNSLEIRAMPAALDLKNCLEIHLKKIPLIADPSTL